ncbi:hypothetical protein BH23ACT6_BH23ACT6_15790 [soil metagenome]
MRVVTRHPHRAEICVNDLRYLPDGGVGGPTISEPLILGHEVSGIVLAHRVRIGDVAGNAAYPRPPAAPSRSTPPRRADTVLHASPAVARSVATRPTLAHIPAPHVQGAFCERIAGLDVWTRTRRPSVALGSRLPCRSSCWPTWS